MFEIICKELTPERRKTIAPREVAPIGKPIRIILAAGGVYLFYYGTNGEAPPAFQTAANAFVAIGVAAILLVIFSPKLVEMRFFAKARKEGCFPTGVSVGEGGMFVRYAEKPDETGAKDVTSVNAERFFTFAEIGKLEDSGEYYKMSLLSGRAPGVFLYKKDFVKGDPEAFAAFIESKRSG